MKKNKVEIAINRTAACLTAALLLMCSTIFAQKIDTSKISFKTRPKSVSKLSVIKGSVQAYKPTSYNYATASANKEKSGKTLTVLKIYPNPVVEQLNINLRLEKETNLSIKITDLLGNEIATLTNERLPHGEHTKTYSMPSKLNAGIYFLRIVAGGEPVIKRISVL